MDTSSSSGSTLLSVRIRNNLFRKGSRKRFSWVIVILGTSIIAIETFSILCNNVRSFSLTDDDYDLSKWSRIQLGLTNIRSGLNIFGSFYISLYGFDSLLSTNLQQFHVCMVNVVISLLFSIIFFLSQNIAEPFKLSDFSERKVYSASQPVGITISSLIMLVNCLGCIMISSLYNQIRSDLTWCQFRRTGASVKTYQMLRTRQLLWALVKIVPYWSISFLSYWYYLRTFDEISFALSLLPRGYPSLGLDIVFALFLLLGSLFVLVLGIVAEFKYAILCFCALCLLTISSGCYNMYIEALFFRDIAADRLFNPRFLRVFLCLFITQTLALIFLLLIFFLSGISLINFGAGIGRFTGYDDIADTPSVHISEPGEESSYFSGAHEVGISPRLESTVDLFHNRISQSNADYAELLRVSISDDVIPDPVSSPVSSTSQTSTASQNQNISETDNNRLESLKPLLNDENKN